MTVNAGVHTETEDHPWTIDVGDHPARADSPAYVRSRKAMIAIVKEAQPWFFGDPPYQDHHGGGVWVHNGDGWLLFLLPAGIEWSAQFCAEPSRVDQLRVAAKALVDAFPGTRDEYDRIGYADTAVLDQEITDAAGVAGWTDSLFNASVPLPALAHTGVLPKGGGFHHYPKPIVDMEFFKRDDFTLWVTDSEGQPAAVAPLAPPGSGDARVQVLYATPGTALHADHQALHAAGQPHVLDAVHSLAKQAFRRQR